MCIDDAGLGLASMHGGERVHESSGMPPCWQSVEHDTYRCGSVVQEEKHRVRKERHACSEVSHLLNLHYRHHLQEDAQATVE